MNGFLFDANVPLSIQNLPTLPIMPASSVGKNPSDTEIWDFAATRRLVIVSKDADFSERIITRTPPPWVVHLRLGSMGKADFNKVLSRWWPQIETLLKAHKLLNVYADRIEGVH